MCDPKTKAYLDKNKEVLQVTKRSNSKHEKPSTAACVSEKFVIYRGSWFCNSMSMHYMHCS